MRVDSHTQIQQAMRVLIHTHISCPLLVGVTAPKPLLNTEFHSVAARSPNAFSSVSGALFRSIGVRESLTPLANMVRPKIGLPLEAGVAKYHPGFSFPRRWRRSQRCWEYPSKHRRDRWLGVPLKTPSRPLRASRFTRLLQTRGLPLPCKSAGYAVRRAWFCSRTLPDVLPAGGWHSHSDVW